MEPSSSNATFIPKLFSMVNDPAIPQISWSKNGAFFVIPNPEEFATKVLPVQFSHNNFASFVRQLNMYGFHKVADLSQLTVSGNARAWAFEHQGFVRNRPDLLQNIHRKPKSSQKKSASAASTTALQRPAAATASSVPTPASPTPVASEEQKKKAQLLIEELIKTQEQQKLIRDQFAEIQRDRERLWSEYALSQEKLYEQQQVTKQVLNFLAAVFQQNPGLGQTQAQVVELTDAEAEAEEQQSRGAQGTATPRSLPPSPMSTSPNPSRPASPSMELDAEVPSSRFPLLQLEDFEAHLEASSPSDTSDFDFGSPSPNLYAQQPVGDEFWNSVLRFEDSNITPFCSMEEDRLAVNAPLNWVPS